MMSRPSFEGVEKKKINVYAFGCCGYVIFIFIFFVVVVVAISWAAPAEYGGSQARG